MNSDTVPDNGGVPLEDATQDERVNEIRKRRGDPELHTSLPRIGTEIVDDEIGITSCNPQPRNPVVNVETDQPTGEVLACGDCGVYYPDSGDYWEFCPQCSSELESFDVAGESR